MAARQRYKLSPIYAYPVALLLVISMTWTLHVLHRLAAGLEVPPRIALFYTAIGVAALLGGRGPGIAALVVAAIAALTVLPRGEGFRIESSSDFLVMVLLWFIGFVLVEGIAAIRYSADVLARTVESRARLRTVMDTAPVSILIAELDGTLRYANEEAERIWGIVPEQGGKNGWEKYEVRFPDGTLVPSTEQVIGRLLNGETAIEPVERIVEQPGGGRIWIEGKGVLVRDESGKPLSALSMFWDITERKRGEEEIRTAAQREALINRIGRAMRGTLDPAKIQASAVAALGEALKADRCYFVEYDISNDRGVIGTDWYRPGLPPMRGEFRLSEIAASFDTASGAGSTLVIDDLRKTPLASFASSATKLLSHRAMIIVPLFDADLLTTSIHVAMGDEPRSWMPDEVRLVETVATQTRAAIEAARVRQREHTIATTLQDALLPLIPEFKPHLDLDAYYKAALDEASVGGDFFDVFVVDRRTVAVVGDVSGKGLAAAAQVAMVRNMLRYAVYRRGTLAESVTELNATLVNNDLLAGFSTLGVGVFDPADRSFTYVLCGDESGLIRRAATGQVQPLETTGPVLGLHADVVYCERRVQLAPGDLFALFTDGLTEAGPTRHELLGINGVAAILAESVRDGLPARADAASGDREEAVTAREVIARLIVGVQVHAHAALRDDVCVLVGMVTEAESGGHTSGAGHRGLGTGLAGGHAARPSGQDTGQYLLQESLIESERRRLAFNREVLLAVTAGRLLLAEPDELRTHVSGVPDLTLPLEEAVDVGNLRHALMDLVTGRPIPDLRVNDLATSVTEAATNAIKYGKGGKAEVWIREGAVLALISDHGPGISPVNLARATLERGYSTQQTLGMGFALILGMVDTVILSTSPEGTLILLTVGAGPRTRLTDDETA